MSYYPAKRAKILPKPPDCSMETIIPDVTPTPTIPITQIKTETETDTVAIPSSITVKQEPQDYEEMETKPHTSDFSAGTSTDFLSEDTVPQIEIKTEPTDSERFSELVPDQIFKTELKEKKDSGTDMVDAAFETQDFCSQVDFGPQMEVKEIQTLPIVYETLSCQTDFPE